MYKIALLLNILRDVSLLKVIDWARTLVNLIANDPAEFLQVLSTKGSKSR